MGYSVMSGMRADVQGVLVDPQFSAWRDISPYTAATLTASANATGTGAILDARVNGGTYGAGLAYWEVSGLTQSGAWLGSVDSANWFIITSYANTAGTTATAQWSGYYPYITIRIDYVSGAARTGTLNSKLFLK